MSNQEALLQSVLKLSMLQGEAVDKLALQEAIDASEPEKGPKNKINAVVKCLRYGKVKWLSSPDPIHLPAMLYSEELDAWGILHAKNAHDIWITEWWDSNEKQWVEEPLDDLSVFKVVKLKLVKPFVLSKSPVYQLIHMEIFSHKKLLFEAIIGGVIINTIAIATSFYALQVYDRVIPTGSMSTLWVLTIGVIFANIYEIIAQKVRSRIYERLIDGVDRRLSRTIYTRFLSIRLDQLPRRVGALAGQLRGYETVRSFLASVTTHLLVDAPFAIFFAIIIATIAGWIALIPCAFFFIAIIIGWYYHGQVNDLAAKSHGSNNQKTGLLVETVEGAETTKSGQGGWRMLSSWMKITDEARGHDLQMRHISEHSQYLLMMFQKFSYVLIIAFGAILASRGELTFGGLIASSILSSRILAPVSAIPSRLVQWAHTKAALKGLDQLWALEDDHFGVDQPIVPQSIRGDFRFEEVALHYKGHPALVVPSLNIRAGEKIALLGPVGSGKTTMLRLLSGMYRPQKGRIFLDGVDISHVSKPVIAEQMGYVQQEGRLFAGTLRENLILGLVDPGDEAILEDADRSGLNQAVIIPHSKGLHQEIYEGGTGLSSGQRQLVQVTRALLRKPKLWLLDEPTASMDSNFERIVLSALDQSIKSEHTLVLVTHKNELLKLVDRIIVIANHHVVLDGPRDQVIEKLKTRAPQVQEAV